MTANRKLLSYPNNILNELEKQRRYLLNIATMTLPCGRCGGGHSQIEASGHTLDDYDVTVSHEEYKCPATGDPIDFVVPFVGHLHFMAKSASQL